MKLQQHKAESFCPASRTEWRQWLEENHQSQSSVWLVYYRKKSNIPTLSWSEAVDEALCFGWIDSKRISGGNDTFRQLFTQRKTNGTWSKINKQKINHLIDNGLMTTAGFASIESAKQNGSWSILDEVEELKIPTDLNKECKSKPGSKHFFLRLPKSVQKAILQWIVLAKRPETRQKRIAEVAECAAQKQRPKLFR